MNSRQRRLDNRYYKHRITVIAETYTQYIEMWDWLAARYGKKIYKCGWRHMGWRYVDGVSDKIRVEWQFANEKRALAFALAWAGD